MGRMVLLLHEMPDGTSHYDWLIERPASTGDAEERCLLTFRVEHRIDLAATGVFDAERLEDHRHVYLTFEGDVAGERGRVRRIAEGRCTRLDDRRKVVTVRGQWGSGEAREWTGEVRGVGWSFLERPAGM